jgi:hypothetical protein
MKMTFNQWKKRPVYVAQCKTYALAVSLNIATFRFRALPGHRDAQAQRARNTVADIIRDMRSKKLPLNFAPVEPRATILEL